MIENNKAEHDKQMRQLQASHEKLEEAHKTSVTEFSELEQKQSKLINDLKEMEKRNEHLTKDQKNKLQEIQNMSQNIKSLNDQLSSKVLH